MFKVGGIGGLRIDRVWESLRKWIVVDDEKHKEQININTWLNQLEVDLVNMKHIKEPPSPMSLTIDSIYDYFKKDRVWKITYKFFSLCFWFSNID